MFSNAYALKLMIDIKQIFVDMSPCTPNYCMNGAICTDDINTRYRCICIKGFTGKHCDIGKI